MLVLYHHWNKVTMNLRSRNWSDSTSRSIGRWACRFETRSWSISVLTLVVLNASSIGPDVETRDGQVSTWYPGRAENLNRSSLWSVCTCSVPVREGKVGIGYSVSGNGRHTCPGCIDVEGVSVAVTHEVVECCRFECSGATVGFYQHHLVAVVRVDVVVHNIGYR